MREAPWEPRNRPCGPSERGIGRIKLICEFFWWP
jgi:hypothetical protein